MGPLLTDAVKHAGEAIAGILLPDGHMLVQAPTGPVTTPHQDVWTLGWIFDLSAQTGGRCPCAAVTVSGLEIIQNHVRGLLPQLLGAKVGEALTKLAKLKSEGSTS